ncbi:MAG TPA: ATP-dependent Clp protease proteolytic subunit [Micromonosporaceae bacterium]
MRMRLEDPRRWAPSPPGQPGQPVPAAEGTAGLDAWLAERLFDRRIVILQGTVSGPSASNTAAALLTLDALAADPIQLHMSAPDGELDAVFAIVDALDVMRAPVHAIATAEVGGGALAVYAAAPRRLTFPHARFRLAEPRVAGIAGTADDVASAAGRHLRALEDLIVRIADATGQPRSRVEDDLSAGRRLDAEQAREYGLVHEVVARPPRV